MGETPLYIAADRGHKLTANTLMDAGARVNQASMVRPSSVVPLMLLVWLPMDTLSRPTSWVMSEWDGGRMSCMSCHGAGAWYVTYVMSWCLVGGYGSCTLALASCSVFGCVCA